MAMYPDAQGGMAGFGALGLVEVLPAWTLALTEQMFSVGVQPVAGGHLVCLDGAGFDGRPPTDPAGRRTGPGGVADPTSYCLFYKPGYTDCLRVPRFGAPNPPDTFAAEGASLHRWVRLEPGQAVSFHYRFATPYGRLASYNAFAALRLVRSNGRDAGSGPFVLAQAQDLADGQLDTGWRFRTLVPWAGPGRFEGWLQWLVTSAQYIDGAGGSPNVDEASRAPGCLMLCAIDLPE